MAKIVLTNLPFVGMNVGRKNDIQRMLNGLVILFL